MKRRFLLLLLTLLLALGLCACGGGGEEAGAVPAETVETTETGEPGADMTGHYIVYGFYNQGNYICSDSIQGYIDLEEDGTGYLNWGEDNQGPITSWTADGEDLTFQAGVAEITGTVKDGVMLLAIDDFNLWLAREDVDVETLDPIASEDYAPAAREETEETRALAGTYYLYGMERDGGCMYLPAFPDENATRIELAADGTGLLAGGDDVSQIIWSPDGSDIRWEDARSGMDAPYPLSVKSDGILAMADKENDVIYYYAQADADVSGLNARPMEE